MNHLLVMIATAAAFGAVAASPALAQESQDVTIEFEVGDFDAVKADWPITSVEVSGDLQPDEVFVVELRDGEGDIVWAGEGTFDPPTTSVPVDTFVAVGDVDEAAIGQREPAPAATLVPQVAGDVVTIPPDPEPPDVTVAPVTPTLEPPPPEPDVAGEVATRPEPELPRQGSGLGGAGQLALSMVIAVVFVAILFRAPLPAATTQRWRR